jgi:transcriptional regulator with XRE-family HTH domain
VKEPDPFSTNLKRLREARGLTRYRLAKDAKLSQTTLASMEDGERSATVPTLRRLADALRCTLDELCGREPSGGTQP